MTAHKTIKIMAFGSIGRFSPHFCGDDYRAGAFPFIGTGDERQQAAVHAGYGFGFVERLREELLLKRQEIRIVRKFGAVKGELLDIGFQHSRNAVLPQPTAGLQEDFGMLGSEGFIRHLLEHSEHSPVAHVVPVGHKVPAFRGTVPLKENASGSTMLALVGAPQIVFRFIGAALQNRVIHTGAGDGNPALDIRVFFLQGGEVYKGGCLFFPSR